MDEIKITRIAGYLHGCSDILSMKSIPSCTTFSFIRVGSADDMLLSFKRYFISLWEKFGVPEGYTKDYDQILEGFKLNCISIPDWEESLAESLDYWINPLFDGSRLIGDVSTYKAKYVIDSIISLIKELFCGAGFQVYSFGKEDEEFVMNYLEYIKSEDYVFRTKDDVFLLHLGISV